MCAHTTFQNKNSEWAGICLGDTSGKLEHMLCTTRHKDNRLALLQGHSAGFYSTCYTQKSIGHCLSHSQITPRGLPDSVTHSVNIYNHICSRFKCLLVQHGPSANLDGDNLIVPVCVGCHHNLMSWMNEWMKSQIKEKKVHRRDWPTYYLSCNREN